MPELIDREIRESSHGIIELIIGDHSTYEDGDVKSATNYRRIRQMHAEGICSVQHVLVNRDGFNPPGSLPDMYLAKTSQYKWERIGRDRVRRTNLWTLDEIEYGSVPNNVIPIQDPDTGKEIHCCVRMHFNLLWKHHRHRLFGDAVTEYHYGGRQLVDHPVLDAIWNEIETHSDEREAAWIAKPMGNRRKYLIFHVDDFDNETAGDLTSPLLDEKDPENPITLKKRKYTGEWRGMVDVVEADVLDKRKRVDIAEIRKRPRDFIRSKVA